MIDNLEEARTVLVLGATGGIGSAVARGLSQRGWKVRALNRNVAKAAQMATAYDWIEGDAMKRLDVRAAAEGVQLIVHAVNPPGYRNWGQLVLPMLDNTIAAAKAEGARILLPGTIYNFGPDAFPVLSENSPQNPHTDKGMIRKEMELRLKAASDAGVGVIILRAGDFFGPDAANNWFSQGLDCKRSMTGWVSGLVDHQARIQETGVDIAFLGHAAHGRPDHQVHHTLMHFA
eukprot:gene46607-58116_t